MWLTGMRHELRPPGDLPRVTSALPAYNSELRLLKTDGGSLGGTHDFLTYSHRLLH